MGQLANVGAAGRTATRRRVAHGRVRWGAIALYGALIGLSVVFLLPFALLLSIALKTLGEISAYPIHWIPQPPQWVNFRDAVTLIDFGRFAWNSLFLSALFAVLSTVTSALVGFGFARLHGRAKDALFVLMLATTMLPPIITLIPTYILFARIGLVYTYWPWVLWGLGANAFFSFLFRQFFAGIPLDLEDAAIVDGCGYARIFWQLFLPLSKPVVATVAIFAFQSVWNDFLAPAIFLDQSNTTLAVAISQGYTHAGAGVLRNLVSAGTVLYTLPVLVLFFLAQRYFVQGIVTTGLKG